MEQTDDLIAGPAGALQVRALWRADSDRLAIVCHPHPLMGGSMDNKVVTTLARYFRNRTPLQSVLLFNFRGVGQSTGRYGDQVGELADAQAVLAWAVRKQPGLTTVDWAGFSFGGAIAAQAADALTRWQPQLQCGDVALVAPAVTLFDLSALALPPKTLVVVGEADEVIAPQAMIEWATARSLQWRTLPDAGHFFHGRLTALTQVLQETLG